MKESPSTTVDPVDSSSSTRTSLPLFYRCPVPLDLHRHAGAGVKADLGLGFARETNAIPLVLDEVAPASAHVPIVFTKSGTPAMVGVVGFADQVNLFLGADGRWKPDSYVPAYVRRYPFIFAREGTTNRYTLCVDEEAIDPAAPMERAFFVEGQATRTTQQALTFCQNYQKHHELTAAFLEALDGQHLLVERAADVEIQRASGAVRSGLNGFFVIDEARFNALPDSVFLDWRRRGWISAVYAHILSQQHWKTLIALAAAR